MASFWKLGSALHCTLVLKAFAVLFLFGPQCYSGIFPGLWSDLYFCSVTKTFSLLIWVFSRHAYLSCELRSSWNHFLKLLLPWDIFVSFPLLQFSDIAFFLSYSWKYVASLGDFIVCEAIAIAFKHCPYLSQKHEGKEKYKPGNLTPNMGLFLIPFPKLLTFQSPQAGAVCCISWIFTYNHQAYIILASTGSLSPLNF